jgi:formylglycine-generating enzyme required for sulfatase activity
LILTGLSTIVYRYHLNSIEKANIERLETCRQSIDMIHFREIKPWFMGRDDGSEDEQPKHLVDLKNDFTMSRAEITVAQYRLCVEAGVCEVDQEQQFYEDCHFGKIGKDAYPMNCINWAQARIFARWLGGDLPTEAQWEYAARSGGQEISYPWGDALPSCDLANYGECGGRGMAVCQLSKGHSLQGVCDLSGNVWEWVLDEFHLNYVGAPSDGRGWCDREDCGEGTKGAGQGDGQGDGKIRVIRGGSWSSNMANLRNRYRSHQVGLMGGSQVGFRVVGID